MTKMMRAARMHEKSKPLTIDEIEVPSHIRPTDVLVEVKACGIVPNLGNVLSHFTDWFPHLVLPKLPAIFGLDATGVIAAKGDQVHGLEIGQRVYVNPGRYCGGCRQCRTGQTNACKSYAFNGYFGFGPGAQKMYEDYPYGGLCEYMTAPQYSIVTLPDNVTHETAARWGYLGTGFHALRRGEVGPTTTVLINGISGTLGLGTALFALALGARKVLGTGRNMELLKRVKEIAPGRIEIHSLDDAVSTGDWARNLTNGDGVDVVIDALGPGAPQESWLAALNAMGRGGRHVNVGAVAGDIPVHMHEIMDWNKSLLGSNWFSTQEGQEMADLAEAGIVDLSVFEHEIFRLEDINTALTVLKSRNGGFSNYVIVP